MIKTSYMQLIRGEVVPNTFKESNLQKYSDKIFIFSTQILSILFTISGLVLQGTNSHHLDFFGNNFLNLPVILTCFGCFLFFVTSLGCVGALTSNRELVLLYTSLLTTVLVIEAVTVWSVWLLRAEVFIFLRTQVETGMRNFNMPGYRGVTETWNVMQHEVSLDIKGEKR